jgi:hypothetical protein
MKEEESKAKVESKEGGTIMILKTLYIIDPHNIRHAIFYALQRKYDFRYKKKQRIGESRQLPVYTKFFTGSIPA